MLNAPGQGPPNETYMEGGWSTRVEVMEGQPTNTAPPPLGLLILRK